MLRSVATLIAGISIIAGASAADNDISAIIAAMDSHLVAINSQDSAAIAAHHLPGHSEFSADGSPLGVLGDFDEQVALFDGIFASGVQSEYRNRDMQIRIFGDTAIVTGYVVGSRTDEEGISTPIHNRRTTILIKQAGQWKEIHVHTSPLSE